ncbi:MAG: TIGR04053 family radical SAM/SPASM domain-containing protein, partial [bacterium]
MIWETTQACDLVCVHCRAEAQPCRDLQELSTLEAMALMNDVRRFGRPLFVLTGGDPFKRPDLVEIVQHGARIGLRMGITPSATPLVTREKLSALRDAGLSRLAISIDGPTPKVHDRFRGQEGSFRRSLEILAEARELGLSTQVNTTVTRSTVDRFDDMADLVDGLGIALWSVFFLVPTGRAQPEDVAEAEAFEDVFHRMYDLSRDASFDIKSMAAPHFRRVILQRQVEERRQGLRERTPEPLTGGVGFSLSAGPSATGPAGRAKGVNDGNGFVFVSHRGDIYPSGFLPLRAGNVRSDDLVHVYRNHDLFRALRDPDRLKGKCGVCEYRSVCGGSRARAWALTGDPLEAEPFCTHIPRRWARKEDEAQESSA